MASATSWHHCHNGGLLLLLLWSEMALLLLWREQVLLWRELLLRELMWRALLLMLSVAG